MPSVPGIPSTYNAVVIGAAPGSSLRSDLAGATAYSCHPSMPSTISSFATRGSFDSTTCPTTPPMITSPGCTASDTRPARSCRGRMYGSTARYSARTSASPAPARGIGPSTNLKIGFLGDAHGGGCERDLMIHRRHRFQPSIALLLSMSSGVRLSTASETRWNDFARVWKSCHGFR